MNGELSVPFHVNKKLKYFVVGGLSEIVGNCPRLSEFGGVWRSLAEIGGNNK